MSIVLRVLWTRRNISDIPFFLWGAGDHYLMCTSNQMPYRPILPFCIFSRFGFDLAYFLQFKKFHKSPCGIGHSSLLVTLIAGFNTWKNIVWLSSHQDLGYIPLLLESGQSYVALFDRVWQKWCRVSSNVWSQKAMLLLPCSREHMVLESCTVM